MIKLAMENGHSIETMLRKYTAWRKGATEADIAVIKQGNGNIAQATRERPSGSPLTPLPASSRHPAPSQLETAKKKLNNITKF